MILRSTAAILHKGFSMGNISLDCSNVGIRQNKGPASTTLILGFRVSGLGFM